MATREDIARIAHCGAEAADRIGCTYSTQVGEMPKQEEVDIRLQRTADDVRRAGPALRKEKLDALIAMAIFARFMEEG